MTAEEKALRRIVDLESALTTTQQSLGEAEANRVLEAEQNSRCIRDLSAKLTEAERDKARLDWFQENGMMSLYQPVATNGRQFWQIKDFTGVFVSQGDTFRQAIDAATTAAASGKEEG